MHSVASLNKFDMFILLSDILALRVYMNSNVGHKTHSIACINTIMHPKRSWIADLCRKWTKKENAQHIKCIKVIMHIHSGSQIYTYESIDIVLRSIESGYIGFFTNRPFRRQLTYDFVVCRQSFNSVETSFWESNLNLTTQIDQLSEANSLFKTAFRKQKRT